MLKSIKIIAGVALILGLGGCATPPQVVIQPFETSITLQASYDDVWKKAVRYLSTNQIRISTIEKDSGLIALGGENLSVDLTARYCDAPKHKGFPVKTLNNGISRGNLLVNEDGGGFVTATVNITFQGNYKVCDLYGRNCSYSIDSCRSRGVFEKALLGSLN